ncbi:MAG: radical SAM protein [Nitrospirae bacterium]|nr:MAG: radical SAM protein [Nitrospirota bacterium]
MTTAKANVNFHSATRQSVFDAKQADPRFREYRRRWVEEPASLTAGPFPIHLDIESTGVCNLRCPFCATTTKTWGPDEPGYMKLELFRRIIDEGAVEGLCSIKLSFRGEPTLHPHLSDMVAYAKQKGILDVYFNTNATLLTDTLVHKLIDAGLDRISVSFEGITKEAYEGYRPGAKYDKVIENVRRLKTIRDQRGLGYPQIRMQTVMLPELQEAFGQYTDFWKPWVDEVAYIDARREGPQDDHRGLRADWACPFLWQRMTILWDGTLLPCLMHGVTDFSLLALGNVKETSIKSLWQSERAARYRTLHREGRAHELEACDRCSFRAMELEKNGIAKAGTQAR